jgi:hypothetical protein
MKHLPVYRLLDLLASRLKLFGFPIFWLWTYLMKVIPNTRPVHHKNCKSQHIRMQHKLYQKIGKPNNLSLEASKSKGL